MHSWNFRSNFTVILSCFFLIFLAISFLLCRSGPFILWLMSSPPQYQIIRPHRTDLQRHGQTQLHFLSSHLEKEFILRVLADSWPLNSGWCRHTCSDIEPTSTKPFKNKFESEEEFVLDQPVHDVAAVCYVWVSEPMSCFVGLWPKCELSPYKWADLIP